MLALLFAADRLTLKKEILEAKNSPDKFIISDRSFYSSHMLPEQSNSHNTMDKTSKHSHTQT